MNKNNINNKEILTNINLFKDMIIKNKEKMKSVKDKIQMYYSYNRIILNEYKCILDLIQNYSDNAKEDEILLELNNIYLNIINDLFIYLNEFFEELFNLIEWKYFMFIIFYLR